MYVISKYKTEKRKYLMPETKSASVSYLYPCGGSKVDLIVCLYDTRRPKFVITDKPDRSPSHLSLQPVARVA